MSTLLIILGIYVVGFFLSLLFLIKFASKYDLDGYDEEKDWSSAEDYSSNAQAYLAFSVVWPIFYLFGIIIGCNRLMISFVQYLINQNKKDGER